MVLKLERVDASARCARACACVSDPASEVLAKQLNATQRIARARYRARTARAMRVPPVAIRFQ